MGIVTQGNLEAFIFIEICGTENLQMLLQTLWLQVKPQIIKLEVEASEWYFLFIGELVTEVV